jgi:hypothetical protein
MRWLFAPKLHQPHCNAERQRMSDDLSQRILAALVRAPEWLRRDLSSKDEANRQRAEEAISAMIASALSDNADS